MRGFLGEGGAGGGEEVSQRRRMTGDGSARALEKIRDGGVVAIVRGGFSLDGILAVADGLVAGGVRVLEIALNSPGALEAIRALRSRFDAEELIGAGTVRGPEDVDRAVEAGARFLVSPGLITASVERARRADALLVPGIFTTTEALAAFDAGCRAVKLFPADALGPGYLKALRAPLDDLDFVPTGGIGVDNVAGYMRAGATAVGVGSTLVGEPGQDPKLVVERAKRLVAAVEQAREEVGNA